jgi:hypothetical protein
MARQAIEQQLRPTTPNNAKKKYVKLNPDVSLDESLLELAPT